MIENEITITLNRIDDLNKIEEILKKLKIQSPIFIIEFEDNIRINFTSYYEYYEINTEIINEYKDYEFCKNLGHGRKEIRIEISRYQSPFSTDDWGRQIENSIDETLYLIKKSKPKSIKFNPKIRVLFEEIEQNYFINIVPGGIKGTVEKGFLIVDSFENLDRMQNNEKPLINKLHKKLSEAFWSGFQNLNKYANDEFEKYLIAKKKQTRKRKK